MQTFIIYRALVWITLNNKHPIQEIHTVTDDINEYFVDYTHR